MRRRGDFNSARFWRWFAAEADGLANGIEALARGEADAEWLVAELNEGLQRYDPDLSADLRRTLLSSCELVITGELHSAMALVLAAPRIPGWSFSAPGPAAGGQRMPFRTAPPPSLDRGSRITARHDAYAPEAVLH